jgi:hypothetical protein
MAKALLGYLGGPDPVTTAELAALRRRVRDLEAEVTRLAAANDALTGLVAAQVALEEAALELDRSARQPALA